MQTQETRGLMGDGTHWLRMETRRHCRTRYPDPKSSKMGLPLSRYDRAVIPSELVSPIAATTFPGKGHSWRIKPISPSQPATTWLMNSVINQREAKTRPAMPTLRQV